MRRGPPSQPPSRPLRDGPGRDPAGTPARAARLLRRKAQLPADGPRAPRERLGVHGRGGWIVAGGLALGLAVLVRPAAMYFAPLALLYCAWKRQWRLASLHALASIVVGLWVLRNAIAFGFPAVAAGAGGALYFGVNPLVDGFDPPYYGMGFDSGIAQDSLSHLSIHGDRTLRAIGALELLDTPLSIVIPMFAHKALSFLFVSETAYVS